MIWIGTSGFQYPEWKGTFYPKELSAKKMLGYYSARFPTTEINYTFRRMPTVSVLSNWSKETPSNFRFTLKAPQEITHMKKLRGCVEVLGQFWEAAETLEEKLGIILFQLPPFLRKDISLLKNFLRSLPRKMKSTFEFRHESWFDEEVFDVLRSKNVALCIADSEKLHTPLVMTAGFGYFRLRDVGYKPADIKKWAKAIEAQKNLKDIYVYFKHEESGIGAQFAIQLSDILGGDCVRPDSKGEQSELL